MSQRFKAVFAAIFVLATGLLALAAEAQQAANPRIALVIGNATYRDAALATTANDAGLVAQTLQAAGFDVVGARDLDGQSMRTAFRDFLQKASAAGPDMQAFVYLAGRAVQYNGDNYFVPVDAQINRDADVPIEAIRISDFTHALAATPGRARIIVLDAARANPYAAQGSPLAPGLALVDPEAGELIAFNAAPGTLAGDEEGPYGVYGKTLAGAIRQGGVDIAQAFDQTRVSVNAETQGALLPWSASKLDGPFYVFERAADAPPPALSFAQTERRPISSFSAEDAYAAAVERDTMKGYREFLAAYPNSDQARRVRAILAVRRESAYWRRTVEADTPRAYWTYLHTYPKGPHIPDARRRLAMLSAGFEPPPDFRPETFADLPPPPPDELVYRRAADLRFRRFRPASSPAAGPIRLRRRRRLARLPPPPPPAEIGVLPVLGVAIPIAIGAVAYQHGFHHNGIAPRGQPRLRSDGLRAAAAAGQHQTCGAPRAGRRGRSRGQRGGGQASASDWRAAAASPAGNRPPGPRLKAGLLARRQRALRSRQRILRLPPPRARRMKPLPVPPAAGNPPVAPPLERRSEAGPRRSGAGRGQCASHSRRSGRQASASSWRAARGCRCAGRSDRSGRQASARRRGRKGLAGCRCAPGNGDCARRADRARPQASARRRGRKALARSRRSPRGRSSRRSWRQTGSGRGGPASGNPSARACPGLEAGVAKARNQSGAEAECRGATAGRSSTRSGPAATGGSCASGGRGASPRSRGRARPSCDGRLPRLVWRPRPFFTRHRRRPVVHAPPPAAAAAACASSAAPGGSGPPAGRATASVRKARIAALSEVGLVRSSDICGRRRRR